MLNKMKKIFLDILLIVLLYWFFLFLFNACTECSGFDCVLISDDCPFYIVIPLGIMSIFNFPAFLLEAVNIYLEPGIVSSVTLYLFIKYLFKFINKKYPKQIEKIIKFMRKKLLILIIIPLIIISIPLSFNMIKNYQFRREINRTGVIREYLDWPMDEETKKLVVDTPLEPDQNFVISDFNNMPDEFNQQLKLLKPGKMIRDEVIKTIGEDRYSQAKGEGDKYDGSSIYNKETEQYCTFYYEYDSKNLLKKVYIVNFENGPTFQEILDTLGKPDYIYTSSPTYMVETSEFVYSSKGITVLSSNLENDKISSIILYKPMTFEEYKATYTNMAPFWREL